MGAGSSQCSENSATDVTHPAMNRKEAGGISSHTVPAEGTLTIFHLVASPGRVWSSCLGFVSLSSLEQFLLARGTVSRNRATHTTFLSPFKMVPLGVDAGAPIEDTDGTM